MQHQAFNNMLIEEQTITNYVVEGIILGYEFKIRYPFFRGTFLSCIENLEFKIEDEPLDVKTIILTLNEKQYSIDDLKNQYKEYWNVLEEATITVLKKGGIIKGIHPIQVSMLYRIPYETYDGGYRIFSSTMVRSLMAE